MQLCEYCQNIVNQKENSCANIAKVLEFSAFVEYEISTVRENKKK